jgi:tetratricopeptide (TPR) repeat protein
MSADVGDDPEKPTRLFLSYGRKDAKTLAERLHADLLALGYEVWHDTSEIRSGASWEKQIVDGLRSSQLVIAILSPHAVRVASDPDNTDNLDSVCLDELSFARFARPSTPIVPAMAIPCEAPFTIFRLDYVDLCSWRDSEDQYQAGFGKLTSSIEAALRGVVPYRSWDGKLEPWDFAAFLNEKRRHFCGRDWLFEEIESWRKTPGESALLIKGDPGTGKSAIVAELVHRNSGGQVLAYHCCQADTKKTLKPGQFVRSIAAMIASKLDEYASQLAHPSIEEALSEESCAEDPASAFDAGILTPLEALHAPEGGSRYILIDALDESQIPSSKQDGPSIVEIISTRLDRLPDWLRIVATTRNEESVLEKLSGVRAKKLDAKESRNLDDVRQYIEGRLQGPLLASKVKASQLSSGDLLEVLCAKSEGNFLFAQQVFEGIERDLFDFDQLDKLPAGLFGLYRQFFDRQFPDESSYNSAARVLRVALAAREPLSRAQLSWATGLDEEDELPRTLERLASYLPEKDGRHVVYHKSFADWLTHEKMLGKLHFISVKKGNQLLADACWTRYERWSSHGANLPPRGATGNQGHEDAILDYAITHLAAHLHHVQDWQRLGQALADLEVFQCAWKHNAFEVKSSWAQLERNSESRLLGTYQHVLDSPGDYLSHVRTIATLIYHMGHAFEALSLRRYLTQYHREAGDLWNLQRSLAEEGYIHYHFKSFDKALRIYEEQERICRQINDLPGLARSFGNQAINFLAPGPRTDARELTSKEDLKHAMQLHKKEEEIHLERRDRMGLQRTYGNQGIVLFHLGDLKGALELHVKKAAICIDLCNKDGLQRSLGNQAGIYFKWGDYDRANELYAEKENICREIGYRDGLHTALSGRARVLREQGNVDRAMELETEVEAILASLEQA